MARPLEICIVTCDFVGPIRNGGIGTAYTSLARTLARAGHRVTVLYALGIYCEQGSIEDWRQAYAEEHITLVPMPVTDTLGGGAMRVAHGVYNWLKDRRRFDIVHYHEWRGIGAYLAQAKRHGLGFEDTVFVAGAHSPVLWHREGMREAPTPEDLEVDHLERQSVALADYLWSPSHHMVNWLRREGWTLPRRIIVRPYLVLDSPRTADAGADPSPELAFFGRLETRKGLDVFCDALDRLAARGRRPAAVTFVGKAATVNGRPSLDYLRMRAERWNFPWRVQTGLDRDAAMAFLSEPNRVAVLPSRLDNLPYTVLECLASRIPFVASNIGGIPEMIRPQDWARVLFELTADSLASRLTEVIDHGLPAVRLRFDFDDVRQTWLSWHRDIAKPRPACRPRRSRRSSLPLVSVCLTTRNRPAFLHEAVESLRAQDYPRVQVVLVDDGSDEVEALRYLDTIQADFDARGWVIVRQPNLYLGAARNRAIEETAGEFVLVMDDDNLAEPHEISTFVRAAGTSGADILTCFLKVFQSATPKPGDGPMPTWPFLGAAVAPGALRNVFGDANAFIRQSVFDRIGGFTEDVGVGCEDWEFFARAVLAGLRLEVVPEPLVRYRQSPTGMLHTTAAQINHLRALRPYEAVMPEQLRGLLQVAARTGRGMSPGSPQVLDRVRRTVIFGSGDAGRRAIALAKSCGWDVGWIVDNNPGMWNRTAHGLPVKSPASLMFGGFDLVIVASEAGKTAISAQLSDLGLAAGEQFVHFLDPVRVGGVTHQVAIP